MYMCAYVYMHKGACGHEKLRLLHNNIFYKQQCVCRCACCHAFMYMCACVYKILYFAVPLTNIVV